MPRAVDPRPPTVDHDPASRDITQGIAKRDIPSRNPGDLFLKAIKDLTGIDLTGWAALTEGLNNWLGVELQKLNQWFADIWAWMASLWDKLFGWIFRPISVSRITDEPEEMLINPGFDGFVSVHGEGIWHWDGTLDRAGRAESGSVMTTCDGTPREMVSNEFTVVEEKRVDLHIYGMWQNLTYTGIAPFSMGAVTVKDGHREEQVLSSIEHPGRNGVWTKFSGSVESPAGGFDSVRLRLKVERTATAGTVHFDDASAKVHGLLPQRWVFNLPKDLTDIGGWIQSVIDWTWGGIMGVVGAVGKTVQDLWTGFTDAVFTIFKPIPESNLGPVQQLLDNIVNVLFGWLPGVGSERQLRAAEALEAQRAITAANSQALQDFLARLADVSITDPFGRVVSSPAGQAMGPNWHESYQSGNGYAIVNRALIWNAVYPNGYREGLFIWQGQHAQSLSPYQNVGIVLASAAENDLLGFAGHNDIICRASFWSSAPSDPTRRYNYVGWRFGGDRHWELVRCLNGTRSRILDGRLPYTPGAGTFARIQAGDLEEDDPRVFRLWLGPDLILEWVDEDNVMPPGRGWGQGMRTEGLLMFGALRPARVAQWIASEQS